jgi:hypothetical protein
MSKRKGLDEVDEVQSSKRPTPSLPDWERHFREQPPFGHDHLLRRPTELERQSRALRSIRDIGLQPRDFYPKFDHGSIPNILDITSPISFQRTFFEEAQLPRYQMSSGATETKFFQRSDYFLPYGTDLARSATIVRKIGSGGTGTVFQVMSPNTVINKP